MLSAIRKHTRSFVVKILAGLLIASFAIWGVGDMFGPRFSGASAFEVGDIQVEPRTLEVDVRREINRLRPVFGDQFSVDQARAVGVVEAVLQRQINDTALSLAARDLGVSISDDLVTQTIRNNPSFKGLGGFDRDALQRTLYDNFLTEEGFIARVRQQLGRDQLIESFGAEAAPKALAEPVYRYRNQKRIVDTVTVLDSAQPDVPDPDPATLKQFHLDNAVRFTTPEYRALTIIRLEASDLAGEISVGDEELKEAYDARADEFTTLDRRQVLQIIVDSEQDARRARQAIAGGRDFLEVAKEIAGMDPAGVDLGKITRDQLLPELAAAAFGLGEGEVGQPVKSPLGWHLFRVADIEAGGTRTFDEVRDDLRMAVAREKAVDSLFDLANRLEDSLGGGATLEEAAGQLNLKILKIPALDASGRDAGGRPVEVLPAGNFLTTAFATDEGADSPLSESGSDGYYVLRVDSVSPPALRPLESIRPQAIAAWKAERRQEAAKKTAAEMVERINADVPLADIAREKGLSVTTSPAITRQPERDETTLPRPLIGRIFAIERGKAAMARAYEGFVVARVKEVIEADPVADREGLDVVSSQIGEAIERDVLFQLAGALRDRYGVSINRQAVDELFSGAAGGRGPVQGR